MSVESCGASLSHGSGAVACDLKWIEKEKAEERSGLNVGAETLIPETPPNGPAVGIQGNGLGSQLSFGLRA